MMDCMTTTMASNMKLLRVASSESVDAMMYCEMVYLTNTRPNICFAVNTLRHDGCKACSEVPEGYN